MSNWQQLTIYIGKSEHWQGQPLYLALVEQAKRYQLVGAMVTRGIAGFGKHSRIHTTRLFELSSDLPMVVTIFDQAETIAAFLPLVQTMVHEGLVTQETVTIVHRVQSSLED